MTASSCHDEAVRFLNGRLVLLMQIPIVPYKGTTVYDHTSPQWQMYQDWLATQPADLVEQFTAKSEMDR